VSAYLLDTHVLLWLALEPDLVPAAVRNDLADRTARRYVSAVSAMEIATKTRIGKLPEGRAFVDSWPERLDDLAADELPLTARHALVAGAFDLDHRDPFDRVLAAQALIENVDLVTCDPAMRKFPGVRVRW
jgi:PIN domain nuclease of toxin-antitoxin system